MTKVRKSGPWTVRFMTATATLVRLGSSKDIAGYLMSLQMRQRCTVVAYNDRGALCVAVATADESSAGLIMHETQLEQVLCVPLSFCGPSVDQAQPQCVFLCSCGKMQDQITAVKNLGTSSKTLLCSL
ncbi:TPA: hypothetical protein ACH3X1_008168 [Trebouxia sp. C0004]